MEESFASYANSNESKGFGEYSLENGTNFTAFKKQRANRKRISKNSKRM